MKKFVALALGMCLWGSMATAQTVDSKYGVDSMKTIENASIYTEFFKQKNFKDALPAWRYVFLYAPNFQLTTYVRGVSILEQMYKSTKNPEYIDTMMMVFDQRLRHFPNQPKMPNPMVIGQKGVMLYLYGKKDDATRKQALDYMLHSIDEMGAAAHPTTAQVSFFAATDLVKDDVISVEDYIDLYDRLNKYVAEGIAKGKNPEVYSDLKTKLDALFFDAGVANCETLNTMLTKKFEAAPDDLDVARQIASLLRRSECEDLPLYATVVEKLYKADPTAEAAYGIAMMFLKRQEYTKAETYLKEAIGKAIDSQLKADYSLRLAQLMLSKNQLSEAKRAAMTVLSVNPNCGQAYMIIGKAYAAASKSYGEDDFDHRSVYWVVVDKFLKAKSVDASVADEATKLIQAYTPHFPSKEDAFFRSLTPGANVTIGSWINETTKARFND